MRRTRHLILLVLLLVALKGFSQESVHVLQRGETLYTLAGQYGVSAEALLDYNAITDPTRLPVGAEIRIPGTYVVSEGEYIYSIARKLGVNWQELLESNGLGQNDVVRPGDVLFIPLRAVAANNSGSGSVSGDIRQGQDDRKTGDTADPDQGDSSVTDTVAAGSAAATTPGANLLWPHPGVREHWDGRFRGVVMSGQAGDTFRSVTTGVVTFVAPFTSFGKLILVRAENGYLYGYAGADRVDVQQGDRVSNGTVLGSVGVSPAFQSARVLFTVWRDNRYIDPENAPRG
jgi:murein DD-endopeptidase MepM/ murein hydrolase activator NlpD